MALDHTLKIDLYEQAMRNNERLKQLLRLFADRLEKRAFEIPPPNSATPDLVLLAQQMRASALLD